VKREFITQHIDVDTEYHEAFGLNIPYGKDIIIFFPEGYFEYIITDGSKTFIRKQVYHSGQGAKQINISFLQYVMISHNPRLFIKSLREKIDFKIMVVFTTL
jgi:hypothetical protein